MKKLTIGLVALLLIVILAVVILSRKNQISTYDTGKSTPAPKTTGNPLYTEGKKTFVVYVQNWKFTPMIINVKKGDQVVLQVKSLDVKHGIKISEYRIDTELPAFKMIPFEFIANRTGTFAIECTVNCGPKGYDKMKASIVVQ